MCMLPAFGYAAHLDGENLPAAFIAHAHGWNEWMLIDLSRQPEVTIFSYEVAVAGAVNFEIGILFPFVEKIIVAHAVGT